MNKNESNILPINILIPQAIMTFMDAFLTNSEQETQLIFEQAIKIISTGGKFTKRNLKSAYTLFKIIEPQDDIEKVLCAQCIVSYLLGINKISQRSQKDIFIALKLMIVAKNAINCIHNKRELM